MFKSIPSDKIVMICTPVLYNEGELKVKLKNWVVSTISETLVHYYSLYHPSRLRLSPLGSQSVSISNCLNGIRPTSDRCLLLLVFTMLKENSRCSLFQF